MNNQLNPATYRKFNNLLSSGAVTVTGPQPRMQKTITTTNRLSGGGGAGGGGGGGTSNVVSGSASQQQQQLQNLMDSDNAAGARCYICDDLLTAAQTQTSMTDMCTTHTSTKFPNKLAQLVGEGFMVIVCAEDAVCSRCANLVNYYDRLENDSERVRSNLLNMLNKKYGINEDGGGSNLDAGSPPLKMQKVGGIAPNRPMDETGGDVLRTRKLVQQSSPGSQQMKLGTQQGGVGVAGTQTQVQRKATKIYKCTSCDYKTSDMRLFNNHYDTCKQQTFQCKTCRQIFPHFGAMKQHMVRDHNTPMDNTCSMCHINFVNETSLRKHMESNHATNVLVTSTTTIPASAAPVTAAAAAAASAAGATSGTDSMGVSGSALYTCNHCQFKSTDKGIFDEHMRKHVSGKSRPFKCRLCSQRFESRDAATVHAKQHQTNYFKCGQCSMSFPKRELLLKHAELHQTEKLAAANAGSQNMNTQKLLQETIDEALSDSVPAQAGATVVTTAEGENNIRFISCSICSLTFLQETYYNQHMELHRQDKKGSAASGGGGGGTTSLNSAATALLSDEPGDAGVGGKDEANDQNAEADIESLFEKLHSEKNDGEKSGNKNEMVITSQEGSGGITFNITIPQVDASGEQAEKTSPNSQAPVSVSIDMPVLDQAEEEESQSQSSADKTAETRDSKTNAAPVSMPSLDDDNEASAAAAPANAADTTDGNAVSSSSKGGDKASAKTDQQSAAAAAKEKTKESANEAGEREADAEKHESTEASSTEQASEAVVASEATEGEAAAGSTDGGEAGEGAAGEQQVAMELDEAMQAQVDGGQIKFIVNENGHLLQLDNHILTDAEGNQIIVQDPEQIHQLLQSVGVLQSGEGLEGETLQMMTDGSGQMVLVHGDNNEQQLIDASLLNSEGQLIIQQGQDGEEGPHVISEDGTRIPVSVSYTEDGQPIVQVQQQVLEAAQAQAAEEKEAAVAAAGEEGSEATQSSEAVAVTTAVATAVTTSSTSSTTGGAAGFFALEEFQDAKTD